MLLKTITLLLPIAALVAAIPVAEDTTPASIFERALNGQYTCTCASRKQQLRSYGATSQDLAIAMLECSAPMLANYRYGDGKTGDSANFGIFKNNWYMIRTACSQFAGQSASQWNNGAVLNSNDRAAITCQHQQQSKYAGQKWWGGQRNGQTGLNNPYTNDINTYKTGVQWIQSKLSAGHLTDNQAFWYDVTPI